MIQPSPNYPYPYSPQVVMPSNLIASRAFLRAGFTRCILDLLDPLDPLDPLESSNIFQCINAASTCPEARNEFRSTAVPGNPASSPELNVSQHATSKDFELDVWTVWTWSREHKKLHCGIELLHRWHIVLLCMSPSLICISLKISDSLTVWYFHVFSQLLFSYVLSQKSTCLMAERRLSRRSCNMPKSLSGLH